MQVDVEASRQRALDLLDSGDPDGAFDELAYTLRQRGRQSDLEAVGLGVRMRMYGRLESEVTLRRLLTRMGR